MFCVGDSIRCISPLSGYLTVNAVYTILEINFVSKSVKIKDDKGRENEYLPSRFLPAAQRVFSPFNRVFTISVTYDECAWYLERLNKEIHHNMGHAKVINVDVGYQLVTLELVAQPELSGIYQSRLLPALCTCPWTQVYAKGCSCGGV